MNAGCHKNLETVKVSKFLWLFHATVSYFQNYEFFR